MIETLRAPKEFEVEIDSGRMKARLKKNLGTFTTTMMDNYALERFQEFAPLNAVDWYTYPELEVMEKQCGDFLLNLYGAHEPAHYSSFSSSGSSEAIFLSLLLLKYHALKSNPNYQGHWHIILSEQAHIAWEKAASCLGIEVRRMDYKSDLLPTLTQQLELATLGVVGTLGTTTDLQLEPIHLINSALSAYHQQSHHFVPIHVDAASGGFIAPFAFPDLVWDFRLSHVKAMNVSSHKFGGVFPSLGWLLVDESLSRADLGHRNSYLGQSFIRYPIQFSHSAGPLAAQHHLIRTLKQEGYKQRTRELYDYQQALWSALNQMSDIQVFTCAQTPSLPGLIFTLKETSKRSLQDLAMYLKSCGWHLPVYEKSPSNQLVARVVIRYGFNEALLSELVDTLKHYFKN